jgi:molybdopterin-containing oxidoreductase family membrane subunit
MYAGTFWDWATFAGTIGLFLALLFLFLRFIPMISIFEMRELVTGRDEPGDRRA